MAGVWLGMMERTDPVDIEMREGFNRILSLTDAPPQSKPVYVFQDVHLEHLQKRLFPVEQEKIVCRPEIIKERLFGKYPNLQSLERGREAPGVLIFSSSWAVDIGTVRNSHVVCEALLISQNSLPSLFFAVTEGSQQLWQHATSTAFQLKQKLVNLGGCSERVCIIPQLVDCQTGALIPRELNTSEEISYPDCYSLHSMDEMESVLRALVIVLLNFSSVLSDELGCEFLNLLTEEQFDFLQKYKDIKELFIHGLPGSGKTVLATEQVKRIRNTYGCSKENILYICENQPLRNFMWRSAVQF
ncbi:hypothetical protein JZ751_003576 [Albula glossodonta]|uniref:Schlafen GTPase-like domain-containing protein n=1 Tax=Albula glossodonta TaxID=121402 RepID=A0A8T2MPS0_9TELE|nr:hypothetical protein JZ751_003576 [Albula glossodonta]